jgi:transcription elongation factor Elf1
MTNLKEITRLPVENELHTCPDCGYERGFHTSFVRASASGDNPVKTVQEVFRVVLICPECGARYDVGWRVPLNEFESRVVKAPVPSPVCVPHGSPAACLPLTPHDKHPPK